MIYISHFLEEVQEISDRFAVLRDGQSVGGGVTAEHAVRSDHRADGRPRRRGSVSPLGAAAMTARWCSKFRSLAGVTKPTSASLQAAPRPRGRHCRADRRGPDRADAGDLRARPRDERRDSRRQLFRHRRAATPLGAGRRHGQRRSQAGRARIGTLDCRQYDLGAARRTRPVAVRAAVAAAGGSDALGASGFRSSVRRRASG